MHVSNYYLLLCEVLYIMYVLTQYYVIFYI